MKYPMYCYRDIKVGFMQPQCDQSDQSAIRGFAYAINTHDGIMNFAPKDYELYKIGEYDTDSGEITPQIPQFIVSGLNVYGDNYEDKR